MFKKGQSGNPAGRKKGSKNKGTIFKERIFEIIAERDDELKKIKIDKLAELGTRMVPKEIEADVTLSADEFYLNMIRNADAID